MVFQKELHLANILTIFGRHCMEVIPCNTAECERGFSHINSIFDEKRTRLLISHTSSLLFINIYALPLSEWKPINYAKSWLKRHCSANGTRTKRFQESFERKPFGYILHRLLVKIQPITIIIIQIVINALSSMKFMANLM